MKRVIFILTFFTIMYSATFAQEQRRTWVVRANLGSSVGITNVSLEKALSAKHSIALLPSYGYFWSEDYRYETFGIGMEYRYYFAKNSIAPKGFYLAGGGSLAKGKATNGLTNVSYDVKGFSAQATAGKQWILRKGLTFDLNVGAEYLKLNVTGEGREFQFNLFLPSLGGGVGYAF